MAADPKKLARSADAPDRQLEDPGEEAGQGL
jgi:hypothetical protein